MRIYRGSDADIVLRPFMVRLSEIVSFDLQLWTSGTYTVKRSTSESGMTTDKENNLINVHFTDKETGYLDAGVLNAKLMYRITDSEYPDGTYDGIITIPQEYYLMTPPDFSGATIEKVYESGYTEGYNTAIQNSVLSINGEKGDLKLKTVNGNELLGEGDVAIDIGVESLNGQKGALNLKTIDNKDVLGEGNMDILSDYSICMFMMYNLTLSEADKGVDLYKYGIGDDAANLDRYLSGFKTIQFLNFNIKDGASYKVPLTIFWDGDGNRQFRFVCEGYEYTYTSIGGDRFDFTSKVKVSGESDLKYFDLTADKAKEAYDEIQNHWDSLSGYTGNYVFRYKKDNGGVYTFSEIGYLRDHSVYFNYLDNAGAYDVNTGNIKFFAIIIWKDGYNLQTYEHDFTIPTKTSQLTNDSAFQTKSEVDTAIENAVSGFSGDQNVIVLDGLTQEERKAIYDKLDKSKPIDAVFVYSNSTSVRAVWVGTDIYFYCITEEENGIKYQAYYFSSDGTIGGQAIIPKITNSLIIEVNEHINESDNFNCGYTGSFSDYLVRPFTRPNAYFILFKKGYGANTKSIYAPFTAVWDKDFYDNNYKETPVTIQFTIDGITYKYRNDLTNENTWQYDGKISMYDSHSINGFNGTSLVLGDAALDATDKNKYVAIRSMMGYDTIFNGDNDGSCPYLTIITTDNQMYKVPVWIKCNKQNDSTTRATFEFDLNGYHYLYTQDKQGDLTYSFTSKTPIGGGTSGDVPTKVSQLENDSKYISNSNTDGGVSKIWTGTQAEYDAIDPKDNSTIYIVDGKYIYWQGQIIGGGGGTGGTGVSSVNGKTGDVKLKTINNIDLTNSVDILPNIRIVQPFLDEAGFRCGLNFNFKIDESGNETIESVRPQGYKKIDVGGIVKNRFFQYFQGGDSPQHAQIGLYQAVFTTYAGDSGAHPSRLTYGTINTWGETHIDNTEDPESEDYFGYYVSFTVISPYTFTKYDVTVLSYYITADIEDTNTWKIIWKKAN